MSINPLLNPASLGNKTLNLYCNSIISNDAVYSRSIFEPLDIQTTNGNWNNFSSMNVDDPTTPPNPMPPFKWVLEQDDDTATISGSCQATNITSKNAGFTFNIPTSQVNFEELGNMNYYGRARTKLNGGNPLTGSSRLWTLYSIDVQLINDNYNFRLLFQTDKGLDDNNLPVSIFFVMTYLKI